MDWDKIIEHNAERLVAVLTELFVMAGFGRGGMAVSPAPFRRGWPSAGMPTAYLPSA
jgi:hypothetical protein